MNFKKYIGKIKDFAEDIGSTAKYVAIGLTAMATIGCADISSYNNKLRMENGDSLTQCENDARKHVKQMFKNLGLAIKNASYGAGKNLTYDLWNRAVNGTNEKGDKISKVRRALSLFEEIGQTAYEPSRNVSAVTGHATGFVEDAAINTSFAFARSAILFLDPYHEVDNPEESRVTRMFLQSPINALLDMPLTSTDNNTLERIFGSDSAEGETQEEAKEKTGDESSNSEVVVEGLGTAASLGAAVLSGFAGAGSGSTSAVVKAGSIVVTGGPR